MLVGLYGPLTLIMLVLASYYYIYQSVVSVVYSVKPRHNTSMLVLLNVSAGLLLLHLTVSGL